VEEESGSQIGVKGGVGGGVGRFLLVDLCGVCVVGVGGGVWVCWLVGVDVYFG